MTTESSRKLRTALLVGAGIIALCAICVTAGWWGRNSAPLRSSDAVIRNWLRERTPAGSTRAAVVIEIEKHAWKIGSTPIPHAVNPPGVVDSTPDIFAELGSYQGLPWYTTVFARWEFGNNDRLIDVEIQKQLDSP